MNKDGAKMVLWGIAIVFILYFAKQIMSFVQSMFGIDQKDQALIDASKPEFASYKARVKGYDQNIVRAKVAEWQNILGQNWTNWDAVRDSIIKMSYPNFLASFAEFGVRENDVYMNQAGDVVDWIVKMDNPMSMNGSQLTAIKKYINTLANTPAVSSISGLKARLTKINQV